MKNFSHKKEWNSQITQAHVEPPPIPLIKVTWGGNSEKDFVKMRLCRDPTSGILDFYEFKISLFGNSQLEDFLLFVPNLNMTLTVSGTMDTGAQIQYLCTLVCGEALHQFEFLSYDVEST